MRVALPAVLVAGFAVALWATGSRRQARALEALIAQVTSGPVAAPSSALIEQSDALPAPVARYLRWALPAAPPVRMIHLTQVGRLRTDVRSGRWMSFQAEHVATPHPPGFVWNARVALAPLLHVRVRDAYGGGEGSGHVSLLSAFTIGADGGTPEMNAGSLHRFLAEAVWYPTALLPSVALRWSAIDEHRALATLTDRGVTVSLEFRFARTGEVTGIYTSARWGTFEGHYQQLPWEGHFRHYERRHGMMVPTDGDVGWWVDGAWHMVWEGTVTSYTVRAGE
jgi:hypothetical protein